ncbi:putative integral membrane protein [Aspergillus niger]|uniref:Putative integral membrane protein n=1 Tax=Aspergillus niger TaxID=5061 RepID=A0A505HZE1_ASPNG|nr:putative integral membrane protein [Aspergillus niger]
MASSRVFAQRLASTMAATTKVARPAARLQLAPKRTFTTQRKAVPMTPFQTVKRQSPSGLIQANARQAFAAQQARRQYSSEIADAMVQLFSYAILGFAFVEAIGLFDLMVAMMCKYV